MLQAKVQRQLMCRQQKTKTLSWILYDPLKYTKEMIPTYQESLLLCERNEKQKRRRKLLHNEVRFEV